MARVHPRPVLPSQPAREPQHSNDYHSNDYHSNEYHHQLLLAQNAVGTTLPSEPLEGLPGVHAPALFGVGQQQYLQPASSNSVGTSPALGEAIAVEHLAQVRRCWRRCSVEQAFRFIPARASRAEIIAGVWDREAGQASTWC